MARRASTGRGRGRRKQSAPGTSGVKRRKRGSSKGKPGSFRPK